MSDFYQIGALGLAPPVQVVRVIDVAVIGPVLIAAGLWVGPLPALLRAALVLFGATTVSYNWARLRASVPE